MVKVLGDRNEERLYLYDADFIYNGTTVQVRKTNMPNLRDIVARHKARYHLGAFLCRPGMKVLDFPCGSGYGYEILPKNVFYEGKDIDEYTIAYCNRLFEDKFSVGDLKSPKLAYSVYDLIMCIEGLEHIEKGDQGQLVCSFYDALDDNGLLLITTPEGDSGPSQMNPYHLCELTEGDFFRLLANAFGEENVQIIRLTDVLHNGEQKTCLYGIARKEPV